VSKRATREALGETLVELADEGVDVVAVEADLSKSTTTFKLAEKYEERFFNVGIAEANMIGVAAGLALAGKIPFTGSFAVFGTGRAYDQIRNTVCYSRLNVKLTPTHAGITVGADGGSHQMLEDLAITRVLPGMRVLVPADYHSAKAAIRIAAATPGPFYVRLGRAPLPEVYPADVELELGGSNVLRTGIDVTIVACGVMVAEALEAAEMLAKEGVEAEVIDAYSIKPLDADTIVRSARKTGIVIACEEHSVIGGLGSAVAEVLSDQAPRHLVRVGVPDVFGTSGDPDQLLDHYGLSAQKIAGLASRIVTH
jgi:transketolase